MEALGRVRPAVLLVEDEAIIRMDLAAELEAHGFCVLEAVEAEAAISLVRSNSDLCAAVVNIQLDGAATGFDLVQAMRRDRPDLTVIVASGYDGIPAEFGQPVLVEPKPYDPAKIAFTLERSMPAHVRFGEAVLVA